MNITRNIEVFERLMGQVQRPGMDRLMEYVRNSDFYEAPASTRYHLSEPGGLLQHSLNVYYALSAKRHSPLWGPILKDISEESLILCALCHDFCKIDIYKKKKKYQKTRNRESIDSAPKKEIKNDCLGQYVWQIIDTYSVDEKFPYGHGEKSIYILQQLGVPLHDYEALAIRFHTGYSEDKATNTAFERANEMHPFTLAVREADGEATRLLEAGHNPFTNETNEEYMLESLHCINRLTNLLTNSKIKGILSLVDDALIMLENPVERPYYIQQDDDFPFKE